MTSVWRPLRISKRHRDLRVHTTSLTRLAALAFIGLLATSAVAADAPGDVRARVDYHVRQATELAEHFDTVIKGQCPRFASSGDWQAYVDGEIDRMVLLAAHVEQAWVEAKTTPDDDVRRAAKAPRKRLGDAGPLVDKLQVCAANNGATLSPGGVWQRIDREVPRRQ